MKIFPRPRIFYVSPWLLAAATGLLVLIVVIFTLNNYKREKELMTEALLQKATTLIRILHSGAKASYFNDLGRGIWNPDPWPVYVQRVIGHIAEDPDVRLFAVIDEKGRIVVHNNPAMIGGQMNGVLPAGPAAPDGRVRLPQFQVLTTPDSGRIFIVARPFIPFRPLSRVVPHGLGMGQQGGGQAGGIIPHAVEPQVQERGEEQLNHFAVLGLDMQEYDQALGRVKFQALILSLIMLLVGVGGWLSLAAVQGFRVSQKTLGDIRAFTALLVAKLPVGIIATDQDGRITTWNNAATEMTDIKEADALGKLPEEILPEEFAGFCSQSEETDTGGGNTQGRERELTVTVDGKKQFLFCHSMAVRDKRGDYKGQVFLLSNLTEIKGLEKEMREHERLAAVGRMAAGVAHEVRNPLSSIKGLALLLKGKFEADSRESETAGLLIQEVERMNRTISELLSFARPASLNLKKVALGEILDENLRLIASDTHGNGITTSLRVDSDLRSVTADRDRLNQVFINLMLNAVQAMEKGGELVVTAKNNDRDKTVAVTVQDTGSGIEPENMPQLFYPYFTTKPGGTGIGLAISQKIISDHKGSIRIDSAPGQGTTVTVELPYYREDSDRQA
ncbi:MAG: ATP-binding protein [Desulfobulbaceae bacterium]|jgi:two-component system sensor histidine kinase HydH|nr:ATP-binding protein [Desulfobulbaceae bacterium]MDY0352177.1 ATP-binding protein [Desulfobulbaceae bacterium]